MNIETIDVSDPEELDREAQRQHDSAVRRFGFQVAIYLEDRAYGGPEEGGWWYDCGELVRVVRIFRNEESAYKFCRRLNHWLHLIVNRGRRSTGSVLSEWVFSATVEHGQARKRYPEERPYYS
jgi:hypothetical protein